jgi:hypothetical protein
MNWINATYTFHLYFFYFLFCCLLHLWGSTLFFPGCHTQSALLSTIPVVALRFLPLCRKLTRCRTCSRWWTWWIAWRDPTGMFAWNDVLCHGKTHGIVVFKSIVDWQTREFRRFFIFQFRMQQYQHFWFNVYMKVCDCTHQKLMFIQCVIILSLPRND